jgi:hypothetical protein
MHAILVASALVLVATAGARAEVCRTHGDRPSLASDSSLTWSQTVTAGRPCQIRLSTERRGPGAAGTTAIESLAIVAQPRNGAVAARGRNVVVYEPRTGFRGEDRYAFRLCGTSAGGRGCAAITIAASVR